MSRDPNPKNEFGAAKPGIHAIPPSALLHLGRAMEDGEEKYGLTNWRENNVSATIYYDAAFRHMAAWWDGEQKAPDSGVHHLGHVMACCAILLDAEAGGNLIDDRPKVAGQFSEMVKQLTHGAIPKVTPQAFAEALAEFGDKACSGQIAVLTPAEDVSEIEGHADDGTCQDEGCPHHGTPHVCLTVNPHKVEGRALELSENFLKNGPDEFWTERRDYLTTHLDAIKTDRVRDIRDLTGLRLLEEHLARYPRK